MSDLIPPFSASECTIHAQRDGDAVLATMTGTADMRVADALATWLGVLHLAATGVAASRVVFDFRGLEFMNSSCTKSFVTWVLTDKEAPKPYPIHFLSNKALHWQARSLPTLRYFAESLITIQEF